MRGRVWRVDQSKRTRGAAYDEVPLQLTRAVWLRDKVSEDGRVGYGGVLRGPRRRRLAAV
jgi:hypothetical protein